MPLCAMPHAEDKYTMMNDLPTMPEETNQNKNQPVIGFEPKLRLTIKSSIRCGFRLPGEPFCAMTYSEKVRIQ